MATPKEPPQAKVLGDYRREVIGLLDAAKEELRAGDVDLLAADVREWLDANGFEDEDEEDEEAEEDEDSQ